MSLTAASLSSAAGSNPYAALVDKQSNTSSALFGGGGDPLSNLAKSAAANPLYQKPGLLNGVAKWDGSLTAGSERGAVHTSGSAATSGVKTDYKFDPFDKKTWDVELPASATKDSTPATDGTPTGTGVVVPPTKYSFNPFDQKTWDVKPPKGMLVDTLA